MKIHSFTHLSNSNLKLKERSRRAKLRFLSFLFLLLLSPMTNPLWAQEINLAIFDTGFCPDLLPPSKLIDVAPVKDFTQSNQYLCQKDKLSLFRFHGHWALDYIVRHYHPKKPIRLHLFPYILFNKQGDQKKAYWELAIKQMHEDKIDLAMMAVGLPMQSNKLKDLTDLFNQGKASLFMAAGQKDTRLGDGVKLFPQNAKMKLLALMFGDYHPALAKSEKALLPPQQLNQESIDYWLKTDQYHQLKDTSLSVVQAMTAALNYCSSKELKSFIELQKCLKRLSRQEQAKSEQGVISIQTLSL